MHNKRSPLTDTPIASSVSGVLFAFLPIFTGKQRINEKKSAPFRLNFRGETANTMNIREHR